ncbi:MAG: hypothetical protein WC307_06545 [Candidatus Nanoarchaeia archaeon]|jgi:hypothetical protein
MTLNILLTKIVLLSGCDQCNAVPDFQINRFAKWSKEWYKYYACNKHVNEVLDDHLVKDEFAEVLEYDNTHLVQCYTCNNHILDLPTLYAGENRYAGNCKFMKESLQNGENLACRLCNQYVVKQGNNTKLVQK